MDGKILNAVLSMVILLFDRVFMCSCWGNAPNLCCCRGLIADSPHVAKVLPTTLQDLFSLLAYPRRDALGALAMGDSPRPLGLHTSTQLQDTTASLLG